MKKLIFTLSIILLIAGSSFAQTMHNVPNGTIGWDVVAPPKDANNVDVPGTMKYQTYVKNDLVSTTGTKVGGEITANQFAMSFSPYITYYAGVNAIFYPTATPTVPNPSAISWSTDAAVCLNGNTFGFLYRPTTNKPGGVRLMSLLKDFIDGLPS